MIRPNNGTKDLLLSITKNCQTLFHRTHRKLQEVPEFKLDTLRKTIRFNPPIQIEGS